MLLTASSTIPDVTCPLCANSTVALLLTKVNFSATLEGENFVEKTQPLAAFICPKSHIFFLRERDIATEGSRQFAA
jgi:hypothetical protein